MMRRYRRLMLKITLEEVPDPSRSHKPQGLARAPSATRGREA
jgi:hypothetical protein